MSEVSPTCPDADVFAAMLQGDLEDDERAALDAHLDTCADCMMLVAELTAMLFPNTGAPVTPAKPQIGRYEVRGQVGVGGMGVVYEAWDPTLRRKVALKVLRADLIDPEMRDTYSERLLREARLLASVSHPNILTVYEVLTWNSQVVMAIHFVEGVTLGDWLDTASPTWREIVNVYMEIGAGLAVAHAQGLVHRDVKPANILIAEDGRVWLTDFGLACVIGRDVELVSDAAAESSLALSALTRTGTVMGTPAYMSPEQHLAADTDSRTDQFSFCAALFEGVYHTRPFAGETRRDLAMQVCTGALKPRPPSSAPSALYTVLARGLARHPDDRFPNMEGLLTALRAASAPPRRRGWPLALGASLAVMVLLIGVGVAIMGVGELSSPDQASSRTQPKKKAGSTKKKKKKSPSASKPATRSKKSTAKTKKSKTPPKKAPSETKPQPDPTELTAADSKRLKTQADTQANANLRANNALKQAQRHLAVEDGQACLAALAEMDAVVREGATEAPYVSASTMVRTQCLMLAGQCAEGEALLERYLRDARGVPADKARASAQKTAKKHCR